MQWVVDAYSLVFAGLLFPTSALGDGFGRKGVMQAGLVLFGGATAFAAFAADSGATLIAARAVMGLAGAMIMPSTLSILTNVFPAAERPKAIAVWAGIAGGGAAIGMIVNGFVLEHWSWPAVFILNLPLAVGALAVGAVLVPTSRDPEQAPIDWLGAVLSTTGVATLVYGLIEAPAHGWLSPETLTVLGGGLVALGAFVAWELRTASPMLDIRLFRRPAFGISSLTLTMVFFTLMGIFFSMSQLFQLVMGYGTFESALRTAPVFLAMIVVAPQTPRIVGRFGLHRTVVAGLGLVATGIAILSMLPDQPSYLHVAAGMAVMATGMAVAMSPTTGLLMSAVPRERAGMGSAMNDTTRELGGALGIAVLGSVTASQYASHLSGALRGLPAGTAAAARSSLAGALAVGAQAGPSGTRIVEAAKAAWMSGLTTAMVVGAVIIAAAATVAWFGLPRTEPAPAPALETPDGEMAEAVAA
jgi:EmrB/QacA subfamily drug resistance transporter